MSMDVYKVIKEIDTQNVIEIIAPAWMISFTSLICRRIR